jgi:hypothetical protein
LNFCHDAFAGIGNDTSTISSPASSAVSYMPVKKSSAAIVRRSVRIVAPRPSTPAG